jgi:hypothetical protein
MQKDVFCIYFPFCFQLLSRHISAKELGLNPVEQDEDTVACCANIVSRTHTRQTKQNGETYC